MKERSSGLELVAIAGIVAAQYLSHLYMTNSRFRYAVDSRVIQLKQQWRRMSWFRWYRSLPGWKQEIVEQRHGPELS